VQLDALLANGKRVCVVSADLHRRPTEQQWGKIREAQQLGSANLLLCTDHPLEARAFFERGLQ
jgi:hypothetical protein